MRIGKLQEAELAPLLRQIGTADADVLLGPQIGEDAGVVRIGEQCLVVASDPVTLASQKIGWYAVHINANDIAVSGGTPRWFLSTVLLPEATSHASAQAIFDQIHEACQGLSIAVLGGHTEVTTGIERPIVSGTMLGTTKPDCIIRTGGALEGDAIILTKGAGIEGAALLALEKEIEARYILGDEKWKRVCRYLRDPGISVVRDAQIALETVPVHAMHDPTEGGVCGGAYEIARASGLGVAIDEDEILVREAAREICMRFGLDPLRTLASGALLVCVDPASVDTLLKAYTRAGIWAGQIGHITATGYNLYRKGLKYPLVYQARDEILKIFESELL